ncbi:NAD-dependent epimerase/dehydratase family protein [Nannocystis punicea]|uniref:NAD(P)-dependent oxidoreductase n=1 Tax=Nannocystis punicea TaxID=2995304 RepID=A0ABY7H1F8_9BACT|nr:NAD(P)-dependent oxidoreductase [Nannocystis poenicansa]WAS92935.1 NAD(P)-dependent oxidoreductase [Nannocystis poenicansa]
MRPRAVVTGAAGTVGSRVCDRLAAAGWGVRGLVRSPALPGAPVELVQADLGDADALRVACRGADVVVHCAAALSSDRRMCRETNVEGTRHLLAALGASRRARFVFVSSVSVYDVRHGWSVDEQSPQWSDDVYPYGRSKVEAEELVRSDDHGLAWVVLRPVPVLSMHRSSFWGPLALERARRSAQPQFASRTMPFVHVDNLADAALLAATHPRAVGGVFDVVDGHGETRAYHEALAAATGRRPADPPDDAPAMRVAGTRIRSELGYSPRDRFAEFLGELARATVTPES